MVQRLSQTMLVLMMLLVGIIFSTGTAQACSCAAGSPQQHFRGADAVFTGEIVDRTGQRRIDYGQASGPGEFTYTVAVDRVFKGGVAETQEFVSGTDGASCGVVFPQDGSITVFGQIVKGQTGGQGEAPQYFTNLCSGSQTTSTGPTSFGDGAPPPTAAGYDATAAQTDPDGDMGQSAVPNWALVAGVALLVALALGGGVVVARHRRHV